ncbi:matrixin family metalloprotease [Peredibacter sp. HCB2-198]|uniref:matrixin family metalloprotease n=1 Tax=Peredibacter sp. HCB2-198 TaxID=3383025 RepID=UPI0038B48CC1
MSFLLVLLTILASAWAHQSSLTTGGRELFWANPTVPITIRTNTSDLSANEARTIILNSMNQWNLSSNSARVSEGSSENEIRFVSNFPYGSAVLGVTELTYNNAGAIQRAVISLNDDYFFHNTSGFYSAGEVFLGDVVTHELGHLFGLSHSEVLNSTMFYAAYSGQSTVSLDDRSGIRQKYDSSYGTITGYVQGGNHVGVLGAHIQAISRRTGEASGAISDENGAFTLGGLDLNDTYYLYVSPIKNTDSLPGYFANTQSEFCPASYVGSFFSACGRENDGKPQAISLTSLNPSVDVGVVSIHCDLKSDEDYSVEKVASSFSPITIYDYAQEQKHEKAFVGWFRSTSSSTWSAYDSLNIDLRSFNNLSGNPKFLKVSLVSYPFGTRLEYEWNIKKNGVTDTTLNRALSYSPSTETYNPDFEALIPLSASTAQNNFQVNVRARRLSGTYSAQIFPAYIQFTSDQHLPYLIIASIWEQSGAQYRPIIDTGALLSDNYACLEAPYTYAVSRAREANDGSNLSGSEGVAAAGCGTIEPPSSGPGSSLPLIALGFMLVLLPSLLAKSRKNFLS